MKEVLEFLQKSKVFFLATTEGDTPHARPFGFVMECGGKLTFCTGNNKPVYSQLVSNPKVAICGMVKFCNWRRQQRVHALNHEEGKTLCR